MSRSYLRNLSTHKTVAASYAPSLSVTVAGAAEKGTSSYPEGRRGKSDSGRKEGEGKEKTALWHLAAESRRSCALSQIFTFCLFFFTLFSAASEAVPCLFLLVSFIKRCHIEVEIFLFKAERRIWGLTYTGKAIYGKGWEIFQAIFNIFFFLIITYILVFYI